jgi:hypothetical protein
MTGRFCANFRDTVEQTLFDPSYEVRDAAGA